MGRMILVCVAAVFVFTSVSMARTWHIQADGTGDAPTIQAGVDSVAPGDTLMLASGTYTGTGNYNIHIVGRPILIISETGNPVDCVIDCQGHLGSPRRGFRIEMAWSSDYLVIQGITVRNGFVDDDYNFDGGAVHCQGSVIIRDCVFESNACPWSGGAILLDLEGEPVISNCTFYGNQAKGFLGEGGAIAIRGFLLLPTVENCSFYSNESKYGGAICCIQDATANIRNSVFVGNSASLSGGGIHVALMMAIIDNCTFHANHSPRGSGISTGTKILDTSLARVRNCIMAYGTGSDGYFQQHYNPSDLGFQCNNLYGNEGGDYADSLAIRLGVNGNISKCPGFCNSAMEPYDLTLCSGSPCLPGNHPDGAGCGLIGALGEGCICESSRTEPTSWGGIKSLYR